MTYEEREQAKRYAATLLAWTKGATMQRKLQGGDWIDYAQEFQTAFFVEPFRIAYEYRVKPGDDA